MPLFSKATRIHRASRRAAFTLIELLTVIAVIGILISILVPTMSKVRENAKKAKTRVQFNQWGTAVEAFRQEYGYYPNFTAITDNKITDATETEQFVQALSGRTTTGAAMPNGAPGLTAGNTKRITFFTFSESDLVRKSDATYRVQDSFGNEEVVVLLDKNYDGRVKVGGGGSDDDYSGQAPTVGIGSGVRPTLPTDGVRSGVIFYSTGAGPNVDDIVKSW